MRSSSISAQVRRDLAFEAGVRAAGAQERDQSLKEPSHRYASLTSSLSTRLASRRQRSAWLLERSPAAFRDGVVLGLAVVLGPLPRARESSPSARGAPVRRTACPG